jgi:predicted nucleic acid-binding protein
LADKGILVDTTLLIDFFRKKNKKKSPLFKLQKNHEIYVSTVSEFEFLSGVKEENVSSLKTFFENINILPFDSKASIFASSIYKTLKAKNQLIEFRDIFIGATALTNQLPIATLNIEHFKRIDDLEIVSF